MPIIRHGYATHKRNGSTRAYRKDRAATLTDSTHCTRCLLPYTPDNPAEAHHVNAYADHGHGELIPLCRTCNRSIGRQG